MIISGTPMAYGRVRLCGCMVKRKKAAAVTAVGRYVDRKAPALARRLARALRSHASDIAPKVAKRYAALTKGDDDIVRRLTELLEAEALGGELETQMAYAIRRAFKTQALTGLQQVGLSASEDMTSQMDQAAKDYAETRGGELIKDLAGTTIEDMRALFGRAIEEGMSADDLEAAVLDAGAFGAARAEMIARTELAFAHVQGNVEGWRQSDQVEKKRWILGDNHDIDDECDEAVDAGEVEFEDDFIDGVAWPPAHPNCICDVIPILRESDADTED